MLEGHLFRKLTQNTLNLTSQSTQELRESETRRLEELAHKMRKQRTAAEDKKEERKVKFTDRLPPAASKRSSCKAIYIQVTGPADIMNRGHKPTTKVVIPENEIRGLQTSKDHVFSSFSPSHGEREDVSRHPSFAETPAAACPHFNAISKPCHCNNSATRSTFPELF